MHRDLIVLSHLRWDWVWQRPQHLISRVGRAMDRTWFVEEPRPDGDQSVQLQWEDDGQVRRMWLDIPDPGRHVGFEPPYLEEYRSQLRDVVVRDRATRVVWMYTALSLDIARELDPTVLVYDVMDDLASFKDAPPALAAAHAEALETADVVFAGGPSLYRGVVERSRDDAFLFPSGVEPEHYAR